MKKKIVWIINLTLLIIIIVLSVVSIKSHIDSQKRIAEDNYDKWEMLYQMTKTVDEQFIQAPDWKQNDKLDMYVSGTVNYSGLMSMEPGIQGSSTETWHFLSARYSTHFMELKGENIPDIRKDEAFQIFSDMNKELYEISSYVRDVVIGEDGIEDTNAMLDLMDEDSEFYQKIDEDVKNFCDKYENLLSDFYVKINNPDG